MTRWDTQLSHVSFRYLVWLVMCTITPYILYIYTSVSEQLIKLVLHGCRAAQQQRQTNISNANPRKRAQQHSCISQMYLVLFVTLSYWRQKVINLLIDWVNSTKLNRTLKQVLCSGLPLNKNVTMEQWKEILRIFLSDKLALVLTL